MSSTILTVIVLVVMWLVVLVPMFTRRREDEARSVERFSSAMRVLARRPVGARVGVSAGCDVDADDGPAEPMGADEGPEAADVDAAERGSGEHPVLDADERGELERAMPSARAEMLARRRRTLGTIVSLALVTAVLAVGWRPRIWLIQGVLDVLLVLYLVWLRQEVRRERARRRRRAERVARGERVARTVAGPAAAPMRAESVAQEADEGAAPVPDDGRWEPRPVPRPTYVDAAPAPRRSYAHDEVADAADRRWDARDDSIDGVLAIDDDDPHLALGFDDDYPTAEIDIPPRAVGE